jgi:hypothetical protein
LRSIRLCAETPAPDARSSLLAGVSGRCCFSKLHIILIIVLMEFALLCCAAPCPQYYRQDSAFESSRPGMQQLPVGLRAARDPC